ncbi:MAG: YbhB/YbcL family Raf kinase inhibitor-like protein [Candidatus Omnitrophota bacterium]
MNLTSPEFSNNGNLPKKFTIDGQGVNPELDIEGIPAGTQSLVLIMDDPDAPSGTFTHWVVYDIPVVSKIEENSIPGTEGLNTLRKNKYVSPAPPSGTHRYIFRVYALDLKLNLPKNASRLTVEKMMTGHVLGKAELVSLYKRGR